MVWDFVKTFVCYTNMKIHGSNSNLFFGLLDWLTYNLIALQCNPNIIPPLLWNEMLLHGARCMMLCSVRCQMHDALLCHACAWCQTFWSFPLVFEAIRKDEVTLGVIFYSFSENSRYGRTEDKMAAFSSNMVFMKLKMNSPKSPYFIKWKNSVLYIYNYSYYSSILKVTDCNSRLQQCCSECDIWCCIACSVYRN